MKIKIKNISGTNQRLLFRPNSPNANVNIIDPTHNPTLGFEESGSFYFCLGTSVEVPTIGCEGAINDITVGYISDGGLLEVYVDDVKVESDGFMFSPDGIANALMGFDISVTPYDAQGNEITEANEPDRYYSVERARFQNMTNSFKQIRIEIIDANSVNTNYTPANSSFVFDEDTNITTFCLAPIEEPEPEPEPEPEFAGETDFAFYSSSNNYLGRFKTLGFQLMGVPLEVDGPIPWRLMCSFSFYSLNISGTVSDLINAYNEGKGTFILSEDSFGVSGLELTESNFRSIFQLSVQDGINYFHYRGTRRGVFIAGGSGIQGYFSITPQTPLKPWNN